MIASRPVAVATAVLLSTTFAFAQQQQRADRGACAADVKAKCGDVQRGQGRIRACLREHMAELSEPCQARLARAAAAGPACAEDVKQNCAGVKPGGGRIVACLKEALAKLSDACKDAITGAAADSK